MGARSAPQIKGWEGPEAAQPSGSYGTGRGDFNTARIRGSAVEMLHLHLNGGLEVCKSPFPHRGGLMVV